MVLEAGLSTVRTFDRFSSAAEPPSKGVESRSRADVDLGLCASSCATDDEG